MPEIDSTRRTHGRGCDPGPTPPEPDSRFSSRRRAATGPASPRTASASASSIVALAAIVGAGVGAFVVLASRPAPPEAAAWSSWEPDRQQARARAPDRRPDPEGVQAGERRAADGEPGEPARRADRRRRRAGHVDLRPSRHVSRPRGGERHRRLQRRGRRSPTGSAASAPARSARSASGSRPASGSMLLSRQALELSLYTFKYVERRRLRGRVHAAVAGGPEQRLGVPASGRRRRRAPPADLSPSARARAAPRAHSARSSWATSLRLTRPRTYAFEFQRRRRRQADPRSHAAHRRLLIRSSRAG